MTSRPRSLTLLLLLAALLFVGGTSWWLVDRTSNAEGDDASAPRTPSQPAPRRGARTAASSTSVEAPATPAPETPREDDADWLVRLSRLREAGATEIPEPILAEAGKGKPPGGGLHEVLRRAHESLAEATTAVARRRAEDLIAMAVENALRPYRQDRANFAALYREVRFGDGRLDVAGGSLVRSFDLEKAADRIDELRPRLQTWCYDALAVRASWTLRNDAAWWEWYSRYCGWREWSVPPPAGSVGAQTTTPAAVYGSFVRPHLDELDRSVATFLGKLFLDLGEPDAAAECVSRARRAPTPRREAPASTDWYAGFLSDIEAEIDSFRELRGFSGLRLPESPVPGSPLERWFEARRVTDVAHAIGADGEIEMGEWDDAMTAAFLEGGLPWAPEQWQAQRARLADAKQDSRDGMRGHVVKSPNWEVFSDVSAEFAAEATLVLEAAWLQAQDGLGCSSVGMRVGARVFARRADYQAVSHDRSGGHWNVGMNSILTFLDDPQNDEFRQFRYPILVHEATHAVLHYGAGSVPSWMNEGLACYVQRWNPTRSMAVNVATTKGWVRRPRTLQAAREEGRLPPLDELVTLRGKWDVDDFGPLTAARYAAAESLFVYLSDEPEHWKLVGAWLDACRKRQDPAAIFTTVQRGAVAKGWVEFIDFICARLPAR